jgi:hypothetical protein
LFLLSQPGDATDWVWPSQEDQKIIFDTYFGLPGSNDLGPFTISGAPRSPIKEELLAAVKTWNLHQNQVLRNEFIGVLDELFKASGPPSTADVLIDTYINHMEDYHFMIKSSTKKLIKKLIRKEGDPTRKDPKRLEEAHSYRVLISLYKATKKEAARSPRSPRSQSSLPRAVGRSVEDAAIISYLLFWVQRKCKTNDCRRWLIRDVIGAFDGTYIPILDVHAGLKVWAWRGNIIFKSKFFARLKMKSEMTAAELILAFEKMPNYHEWIISNSKKQVVSLLKDSKKQVVSLLKDKSSITVADPPWPLLVPVPRSTLASQSPRKPRTKSDILEHVNALNEYGDLWDFIDRQQFPSQWNQNTTPIPVESRTRLLTKKPEPSRFLSAFKNRSIPEPRSLLKASNSRSMEASNSPTLSKKAVTMSEPVIYAYLLWSLDKNQSLHTIFDAFRGQTMRLNSGLQEELSAGLKVWTWGSNVNIYYKLLDLFENSDDFDANNVIAEFKKVQSYHTVILKNTKDQIKSLVWNELEANAAIQKFAELDRLSKYNQLWKFIQTQNTQLPGWGGNNISLQTDAAVVERKESSKGMGTGRALWRQRTRIFEKKLIPLSDDYHSQPTTNQTIKQTKNTIWMP